MVRRTARAKRTAVRVGDQYLLRLPPGMRERLEQRAAANSRTMAAEVIEAIEQHLTRTDRVTQLWEFFGKHQQYIEAIPLILSALWELDIDVYFSSDYDRPPTVDWKWSDWKAHIARAAVPLLTADQVQTIKALLKETDTDEEEFLARVHGDWRLTHLDATSRGTRRIEDIRNFEFEPARNYLWGLRDYQQRMRNRSPT